MQVACKLPGTAQTKLFIGMYHDARNRLEEFSVRNSQPTVNRHYWLIIRIVEQGGLIVKKCFIESICV